MQVLVLVALLLIGVLMVSTFRYRSFKKFDLRQRWSYRAFVPIAAIILVIAFEPRTHLPGARRALHPLRAARWLSGEPRRAAPAGDPSRRPVDPRRSDRACRPSGAAP